MSIREVRHAGSKYTLTGRIDLSEIKEIPEELPLRIYAVRDGKVLGTTEPKKNGSFSIEFSHPLETPVGVNIVVAPAVPEKSYQNIVTKSACMETLEHPVSALKWKKGDSYHFDVGTIKVTPPLYQHWAFWTRPFHIHGRVRFKNTGNPVPFAVVDAFEVDPLAGGGFAQDLVGSGLTNTCGNFHITFPWFLVLLPQGRPDLVFRVSQKIDGTSKVIYSEDPSQTRWDMVDNTFVYLWVKDDCLTFNDPDTDRPGDCSFLFTRVGLIGVENIGNDGYANIPPSLSAFMPLEKDAPFGATLHLCGWFGESSDITHYRIQYRKDGGQFKDISDPLSNSYYDFGPPGKWVTALMGPLPLLGGQENLFTTPYLLDKAEGKHRPWWFPDLLAQWNTAKADGDGRYTIRILGYKWDGTTLSSPTCLVIEPIYGEIELQIDNTAPESEILNLIHTTVTPGPVLTAPGGVVHTTPSILTSHVVQPCDILDFKAGDYLTVHFKAHDANGHLCGYELDAMYGHNCRVTPAPAGTSDQYDPTHLNPAKKWYGELDFTTAYLASSYGAAGGGCIAGNMPSCAYQFRLGVWKRTTNGYGRIYTWVEDTTHVTIKRV